MPSKFYSFAKVLSYNAAYNFIVGGRGIGKTFGAKKKAISDFIRTGEQFIYLRRYREELTLSRLTFFADLEAEGLFADWEFRANGKLAQMAPISTKDDKKRQWQTVGYFVSLSTAQSMKSVSFAKVTKILFDEFIIEKGYTRYIPDEHIAFNNFYSTVDRYKGKTRVFFLANSVSITNPYFISYQIDPVKADKNGILKIGDGKFAICHFPDSKEFENEVYQTAFGKFIEGTDYAEYAVANQFSDNNDNLIGIKGTNAKYKYSIETQNGTFSVWHEVGTNFYYCQSGRPAKEIMFTLLLESMDNEKTLLRRDNKLLQLLRAAFTHGRMYFDKPATRNALLEVFK